MILLPGTFNSEVVSFISSTCYSKEDMLQCDPHNMLPLKNIDKQNGKRNKKTTISESSPQKTCEGQFKQINVVYFTPNVVKWCV